MDLAQIEKEIEFTAVKSRGPGGQNVNKVSSAAFMTWDYRASQGVNDEEKQLIYTKLQNHINKDGKLYLRSDEFRDLTMNKSRGVEKLQFLLERAFHRPKKRNATKPTKASKMKKRMQKSRRSEIKKSRQKVW